MSQQRRPQHQCIPLDQRLAAHAARLRDAAKGTRQSKLPRFAASFISKALISENAVSKKKRPQPRGERGGGWGRLYASVISSRHRPQRRAVLLVPAQSPVFETARVLLCLCDA